MVLWGLTIVFWKYLGDNYSLLWPKWTSELAYYVIDLDDWSSVVLVATKFESYASDFQCHVLENCRAMLQNYWLSSSCKLRCYLVRISFFDCFWFYMLSGTDCTNFFDNNVNLVQWILVMVWYRLYTECQFFQCLLSDFYQLTNWQPNDQKTNNLVFSIKYFVCKFSGWRVLVHRCYHFCVSLENQQVWVCFAFSLSCASDEKRVADMVG